MFKSHLNEILKEKKEKFKSEAQKNAMQNIEML